MGNTKANRTKILINATVSVLRRPTHYVLKQMDRSNPSVRAEVEPVPGATRNTDEIPGPNLNADYGLVLSVDME